MPIKNNKNAEQLWGKDIDTPSSSDDNKVMVYNADTDSYEYSNDIDGGTLSAQKFNTQIRRSTAVDAMSSNPVLNAGEPGFETDTGIFKIGDGVTAWNSLPAFYPNTYNVIGVAWDYTSNNPALTTINEFDEKITVDSTVFANHPIYSKMRRCNVDDTGDIVAWYGDTTFDYTGGNGQVMVYVPAFWYRSYKDDQYIRYFISATARSGFKRHPAFVQNEVDKDYFMWGAFEGCAYDTSSAAYNTTDAAGVDFNVSTGDVLSSIAGVKPISGANNSLTRANARILAENRGDGWQQIDFNQVSALQMLFMIEAGTLNSQSIYKGVTNLSSGTGNESVYTGYTAGVGVGSYDLGNASGEVSVLATQPFSYRGIENFYGNIWKWVDGINITDNMPWIADHGYVDDTVTAPYVDTGLTLANAAGYVSAIGFDQVNDHMFLASAVLGSSDKYLCDYYNQNSGLRVARFGGYWDDGAHAGAFLWSLNREASRVDRDVGARLAFVPQV